MDILSRLVGETRLLVEVDLWPVQGERFQPTGFPNLGPALYTRPTDGKEMLLVESVQSMANRLEAIAWDRDRRCLSETLEGLPYVEVVRQDGGEFLTATPLEAHRLASAFVKDGTLNGQSMKGYIRELLGLVPDGRLDWPRIYQAVFKVDPLCLVHGVFFADKEWVGQPKIPRALSAFVEAEGVREVTSGGVKRDDVSHTVVEGRGAEEGYGYVPFSRVEFTAERITAYFNLDLAQIRSYRLERRAQDLLTLIALWEMSSLVEGNWRLRTACDLVCRGRRILRPEGVELEPASDLGLKIRDRINECAPLFPEPRVLRVVWEPPKKKEEESPQEEDELEAEAE